MSSNSMSIPEASFYGRELELRRLREFVGQPGTGLLCVRGRRRVGKSRLLEKFHDEQRRSFFVEGRWNESLSIARRRVANEWDAFIGEPVLSSLSPRYLSWDRIFDAIVSYAASSAENLVIVFDEIQWLDKRGGAFVGTLKAKWSSLQRTQRLKVIIAGSSNKFFRDNVEQQDSPLRGLRTVSDVVVHPFSLGEVKRYWFPQWTYEEVALGYMMLGGVPYYLERVALQQEENFFRAINGAVFTAGSIFLDEFGETLNLEFTKSSRNTITKILGSLGQDGATQDVIIKKTNLSESTMHDALAKLLDYGLIF